MHDAMLSEIGSNFLGMLLAENPGAGPGTGAPFSKMTLGESFEL